MILKTLFTVLLVCWLSNASASVITYKSEKQTSRLFLQLAQQNEVFQASIFKQDKGQYQQFIGSENFNNLKDFYDWKDTKYPQLEIGELTKWSINNRSLKSKSGSLWTVSESWNSEWESKYAKWIEEEVDAEYFYRHQVKTDCADVIIGTRWIFARIHKLPVANRLVSTGDIFTQDDVPTRWGSLSRGVKWYEDKLFIRVLNFVMNSTSSWSIERDSYPVSLDQAGLIAGRYIITNNKNSWHVRVFSSSDYGPNNNVPLYTWASTSPRENRILIKEIYLDQGWPTNGESEVMAHRWPVRTKRHWRLAEDREHPNYSAQQYSGDGLERSGKFYESLFQRIKPNHSVSSLMDFALKELKVYVEQRIEIVSKGADYCRQNSCPPGSRNWDDWSTPSRDSKMDEKFSKYEELFSKYQYESGSTHRAWVRGLDNTFVDLEGLQLSLSDILFIWKNKFYSSDPNTSLLERWGLNFNVHFEKYSRNLNELFLERNDRLSNTDCTRGCQSSSGSWWDYHTYHVDYKILEQFSIYEQLCTKYGNSEDCVEAKEVSGSEIIEHQGLSLSISEWEKRIPLFNSDPRATQDKKLGYYPLTVKYLFKDLNSLFISKNNYALINENIVIDLIKKEEVLRTDFNSRILLHKSGKIFLLKDNNLHKRKGDSWDSLFKFSGKVSSFQTDDTFIFYDKSNVVIVNVNTMVPFVFMEEQISLIKRYKDLFIIWTGTGGVVTDSNFRAVLASLDKSYEGKISKLFTSGINFVGQLSDKNNDKYCPFLFDVKEKNLKCLIESKSYLEFYNETLNTLVHSIDVDQERKNIYISSIKNLKLEESKFLNNFLHYYEVLPDGLLLLTASGNYYEPSRIKTIYRYNNKKLSIVDPNFIGSFYRNIFFHYSDDNLGTLALPSQVLRTPSRIEVSYSASSLVKSADPVFIWRYNSGKGDLEGIGGITFNLNSFISGSEIYPEISTGYGPFKLSEQRFQRLKEKVANFQVYSGTVSTLNEDYFLWVK